MNATVNPKSERLTKPVGAQLRATREAYGIALRDLAIRLKVREDYLQAIEDSRMQVLPARTYALGFVRSYAQHFHLDVEDMLVRFRLEYDKQQTAAPRRGFWDLLSADNEPPRADTRPRSAHGLNGRNTSGALRAGAPAAGQAAFARLGEQAAPRSSSLGMATKVVLIAGVIMLSGGAAVAFLDDATDTLQRVATDILAQMEAVANEPAPEFAAEVTTPRTNVPPDQNAQNPAALGGEIASTDGDVAPPSAAASEEEVWEDQLASIIAARQNELLLRARPVSVTRVIASYNQREVPEFITTAKIEIRAVAPNWLQVEDEHGRLLYAREMSKGTSFALPCCAHYIIAARDAGALHYIVNGKTLRPAGEPGQTLAGEIVYSVKLARAAFSR